MRGNGNDRSPVTLSSNLVLSPLFNVFPTGPHSKGLGSTSSYTALPEPGNAGGRAEMQGSGNDRGPVTILPTQLGRNSLGGCSCLSGPKLWERALEEHIWQW